MEKFLSESAKSNFAKLVGKMIVRTNPILEDKDTGFLDLRKRERNFTYCENPVKLISVTDTHVIIEIERGGIISDKKSVQEILEMKYYDENWVESPFKSEETSGSESSEQNKE